MVKKDGHAGIGKKTEVSGVFYDLGMGVFWDWEKKKVVVVVYRKEKNLTKFILYRKKMENGIYCTLKKKCFSCTNVK